VKWTRIVTGDAREGKMSFAQTRRRVEVHIVKLLFAVHRALEDRDGVSSWVNAAFDLRVFQFDLDIRLDSAFDSLHEVVPNFAHE